MLLARAEPPSTAFWNHATAWAMSSSTPMPLR